MNTLEFQEINVGLNIFDKVGLIIHKLEYEVSTATIAGLTATGDIYELGLVSSNQIANMAFDQRGLIHKVEWVTLAFGTAATMTFFASPRVFDFSTLPGGGLLIPPKPLYLGINSASVAVLGVGFVRIYFTIKPLKDADYFELLETYRFYG